MIDTYPSPLQILGLHSLNISEVLFDTKRSTAQIVPRTGEINVESGVENS